MRDEDFYELKNLLRYQCKSLDEIKNRIAKGEVPKAPESQNHSSDESAVRDILAATQSIASDLRGLMRLIRIILWLVAANAGFIGISLLVVGFEGPSEIHILGGLLGVISAGGICWIAQSICGESKNRPALTS